MGNKDGDIQKEINEAWKEKGHKIVREVITDNESRLINVRNAMRVLEFFCGKGLADAMPLAEGIGFLGEEVKKKEPGMNRVEIQNALIFLRSIIGEEYPNGMQLEAVMKKFEEEERLLV
ncbi:MAG: hypothetical protein Q7R94_01975 [bacterium]|nr:hypothetical protein [bacterium]